jgi:cell division protein FtsB
VRVLLAVGAIILIGMQVRLWTSDVGILARGDLEQRVSEQVRRTEELRERNRLLAVEVAALKSGSAGVEARARSELGMIKNGETFYLVVDP